MVPSCFWDEDEYRFPLLLREHIDDVPFFAGKPLVRACRLRTPACSIATHGTRNILLFCNLRIVFTSF